MTIQDIIFTLLLNALPIIILIIPLFFIWKKVIGKLYFRIVLGIVVFYLIYWILPIIFQIGVEPINLGVSESNEGNATLGIGFIISHMLSLILLFSSYPLVTLPFIFFVAPFISLLLLWNHLRKEEGTLGENLTQVTYDYKDSPFKQIRSELIKNDWSREKEILKLMIVLLPISLYLLQVILDISNLQSLSLTTGEAALGWFLEILFVYLATFIFSIELLFSSKIAYKGRYIGENLREQTYKSLYQVGAPISVLSLILFVVQYSSSIFIIIYFFAYFIMASIIFVLFLNIFEPISIFLFIKTINWFKTRKDTSKKGEKDNWYFGIVFGGIALLIYVAVNMILSLLVLVPLFGEPASAEFLLLDQSRNYNFSNPTLYLALKYDLYIVCGLIISVVIPILIFSLVFLWCMKYANNYSSALKGYVPIVIILAVMLMSTEEFWLTGQISYTEVFGSFTFYTVRTASFDANLFSGGQMTLLGILAIPYIYSRIITAVIIWSVLLVYIGKDFKTKNIPIDDKNVEKIVFSQVMEYIRLEIYLEGKTRYLITKNEKVVGTGAEQERDEIKDLLKILDDDTLLKDLMPEEADEKKRFYYTLKYLYAHDQVKIWKPEFSLIFEKVEKQNLYVMYTDGRDVFNYAFVEEDPESQTDPALISGMFSAITSFIQETTQSKQFLKVIDHGDISILIEYGKYIFSALFVKGKQSSEVRAQLKEFINQFEEKHADVLGNWNGALAPFRDDHLLLEEIFVEE